MMSEGSRPIALPAEFLAEIERLLTPMYAECLTDETRKVRNLLLVTSFVLVLSTLGVVEVGREGQIPLFGVGILVTTGMRALLMFLCLYFLVSFSLRSYTEWKVWRLRQQAPMIQFLDLLARIESSWQALTNDSNRTLKANMDALKRLTELNLELMQLKDQGREKRVARNREFNELHQQLTQLESLLRSQAAAPEIKLLEAQLFSLHDALRPAGRTLRIRYWWEMLFPIGFAASAMVSGLFWR
jgi:hypothetical protein